MHLIHPRRSFTFGALALCAAAAQAAVVGLAVGTVGGIDAASVMQVSANGIGHVNLVPYYTVLDGFDTYINIVNTDTRNGKAVKLRFRTAGNGDTVFDFTLLLSPGDVWAGALTKDAATGLPRLVHGEAVLSEAQVRGCGKPADRIACSSWPLEEHGRGRATAWEFLPDGEWYGIPWGCLVVRGFDNLLVAGRNLSAEHAAQASVRVAGPCMALGEAAGAGAAASVADGGSARTVDVGALQRALEREGAILTPDFRPPG